MSEIKKRKFKKRYVALGVVLLGFVGLVILLQSGVMAFRTSDEEAVKLFEEAGSKVPEFGDLEVEGRDIHYWRMSAEDSLPLVVFVHGSPGSADNYSYCLRDERLQSAMEMITIDRPGFGYSDYGTPEPSLEKQAAVLRPFLESFGKGRKKILVGHSLGGPIVSRAAIDYPDLVDGIVIIAGSIDPELEPEEWFRPILNWWGVKWILPGSIKASNGEIMGAKAELEKMMAGWQRIEAPVVVIQGEADTWVPKGNADFAERMLVNSPSVEVDLIPEGDHFILWSQHEQLVKRLLSF